MKSLFACFFLYVFFRSPCTDFSVGLLVIPESQSQTPRKGKRRLRSSWFGRCCKDRALDGKRHSYDWRCGFALGYGCRSTTHENRRRLMLGRDCLRAIFRKQFPPPLNWLKCGVSRKSQNGFKVGEKWVSTHFLTHYCTQKPTFGPISAH